MPIRIELNLRLPNSPGALADVCRLLDEERVNIVALSLEAAGTLRLVVDNHVRAAAVLRDRHHQVTEREVILVPVSNEPGGAVGPLRLLEAAGGNIEYAYGSTAEASAATSIVVGVADAMRAASAAGL
jgi:hypothetical protein